ncbi:MAG TPA: glutamate racemase [Candidatus Binatia bacterium]|jgi:glutamate racemase|nr:glutamate racemase [Candidatus Binatia bacterium]
MIGVFDSGLGGLTVVKELFRQLPGRGIVYFGDTARTPYGPKGKDVIARFAVQDARFLMSQGADAIIVACNTVSALAIDDVRMAVDVPVFEVVSPAVARAAAVTKGKVGVIGTRGTVGSGVYAAMMAAQAPEAKVYAQACPLFVPLVEEGWLRRPEAASIAREYLRPLRSRHIDTLILGCTHYPFLKAQIAAAAGPKVRLVDPARETVADFARFLEEQPLLDRKLRSSKTHRFFASDATPHAERIASRWLGRGITLEKATLE